MIKKPPLATTVYCNSYCLIALPAKLSYNQCVEKYSLMISFLLVVSCFEIKLDFKGLVFKKQPSLLQFTFCAITTHVCR